MIDTNSMTRIRINFLRAFEGSVQSRPAEVSRSQLQEFVDGWNTPSPRNGPLGMPLNFPSWLTNPTPNPYKVKRGVYRLPWSELDAYTANENAKASATSGESASATETIETS